MTAFLYYQDKIKSRHFCKNSKCRLFCRMKMCYNISESREFILLRRWKFELYGSMSNVGVRIIKFHNTIFSDIKICLLAKA